MDAKAMKHDRAPIVSRLTDAAGTIPVAAGYVALGPRCSRLGHCATRRAGRAESRGTERLPANGAPHRDSRVGKALAPRRFLRTGATGVLSATSGSGTRRRSRASGHSNAPSAARTMARKVARFVGGRCR